MGSLLRLSRKDSKAWADTRTPLFQRLDVINEGSHILVILQWWKFWMLKSLTSQRDTKIFCAPRPTLWINSVAWASATDPRKPNCLRPVIQRLCYLAVNDRVCQIMNNKLDHKREGEGLRRRSRIARILPAIIKLGANSWEQNQAMSFSSKLVPNPPPPSPPKKRFSFENYLECCEAK